MKLFNTSKNEASRKDLQEHIERLEYIISLIENGSSEKTIESRLTYINYLRRHQNHTASYIGLNFSKEDYFIENTDKEANEYLKKYHDDLEKFIISGKSLTPAYIQTSIAKIKVLPIYSLHVTVDSFSEDYVQFIRYLCICAPKLHTISLKLYDHSKQFNEQLYEFTRELAFSIRMSTNIHTLIITEFDTIITDEPYIHPDLFIEKHRDYLYGTSLPFIKNLTVISRSSNKSYLYRHLFQAAKRWELESFQTMDLFEDILSITPTFLIALSRTKYLSIGIHVLNSEIIKWFQTGDHSLVNVEFINLNTLLLTENYETTEKSATQVLINVLVPKLKILEFQFKLGPTPPILPELEFPDADTNIHRFKILIFHQLYYRNLYNIADRLLTNSLTTGKRLLSHLFDVLDDYKQQISTTTTRRLSSPSTTTTRRSIIPNDLNDIGVSIYSRRK